MTPKWKSHQQETTLVGDYLYVHLPKFEQCQNSFLFQNLRIAKRCWFLLVLPKSICSRRMACICLGNLMILKKEKKNVGLIMLIILKFIYSEKATQFCEIFTLLLSYVVPIKSIVKISQNFVGFSEYKNFNRRVFINHEGARHRRKPLGRRSEGSKP